MSATPLSKISELVLEEMEDKNIKMLEYWGTESDSEQWDFAERMVAGYNQRSILEYVLGEIMEDEGEVQEENIGIFMLCLKTVIDCFDRDYLAWAT